MLTREEHIRINVAASKLAGEVLSVYTESDLNFSCALLTDPNTTDEARLTFRVAYWTAILQRATKETEGYRHDQSKDWIKPMSDEEASVFGMSTIDFGKYAHRYTVAQIAEIDSQYLGWIAEDEKGQWRKRLNRYLLWRNKQ